MENVKETKINVFSYKKQRLLEFNINEMSEKKKAAIIEGKNLRGWMNHGGWSKEAGW